MSDPRTQAIEAGAIALVGGSAGMRQNIDPERDDARLVVDAVWPIVEAAVRASVLSDEAIERGGVALEDALQREMLYGLGEVIAENVVREIVEAALGVVSSESEKP